MAKIAVASTDGIVINEHFGSAEEFLLYEVFDNGDYNFIERRLVPKDTDVSIEHGKAIKAAKLLQDVEAVLVAQIGKNATGILESIGIRVFAINGEIEKSLRAYGQKRKIIRNQLKN